MKNKYGKAIKLSKIFHDKPPSRIRFKKFKWPRELVRIGYCAQLDYISDKFDGKWRRYFHEFKKPCIVFASPEKQSNGDMILIIRGKFKIIDRGIIG